MSIDEFRVGQTMFIVTQGRRSDPPKTSEGVITKVGRKWVTIGEGWNSIRFDADTMQVDGRGFSPNESVYFSREQWEQTTDLWKAWDDLRTRLIRLPYSPPDGWTLYRINELKSLLP